ncbi:MAG: hypothetical protein J0H74_17800 [Chitinophagaceae bacterium]|nr:hypothetical protein [Chitinophagaceae bacterium]
MKVLRSLPIIFFAGIALFTGCKKDTVTNNGAPGDFPAAVSKVVSAALMDSLKKAGMTIYPGSKPPIVNGNYAMKSDSTIYAGGKNINDVEKFGDPVVYNASAQDTANNTISLQFRDAVDATITGGALSTAYISGSGNNFTIFSPATYMSVYGSSATFLYVVSGTLTSKGINNLRYCVYLLSKTDAANSAVDNPVGYFTIGIEAYPFFTPKVP